MLRSLSQIRRIAVEIAVEVSLNTLWVLKILAKGITSIMLTSKTGTNGSHLSSKGKVLF
jgi:hypothetical protein